MRDKELDLEKKNKELVEQAARELAEIVIQQYEIDRKSVV